MCSRIVLVAALLLSGVYGDTSKSLRAAVKAADHLIREIGTGDNDDFIIRTVIAISFLERQSSSFTDEKTNVTEALSYQLRSLLKEGVKSVPIYTLALHINAQYALCQDPREFFDVDLLNLLRLQTDAMHENMNLPIVFLTLCLGKESTSRDFDQLVNLYDKQNRIGTKALAVVAMAACRNQATAPYYEKMKSRVENFMQLVQMQDMGIYSKALVLQAYNAWNYDSSALMNELLQHQIEDGSFGDVLSTCAAIPALLNESLANLQCKRNYKEPKKYAVGTPVPDKYIDYTIIIPFGENVGQHLLRISFRERKSLYELMEVAAKTNPMYSFTFEETKGSGKKVNSLAGIEDDVESGQAWQLYKTAEHGKESHDMIKVTGDIDWVYPDDGDNFVYKYEF